MGGALAPQRLRQAQTRFGCFFARQSSLKAQKPISIRTTEWKDNSRAQSSRQEVLMVDMGPTRRREEQMGRAHLCWQQSIQANGKLIPVRRLRQPARHHI